MENKVDLTCFKGNQIFNGISQKKALDNESLFLKEITHLDDA